MITVCFAAFTVVATGKENVYLLPNCDPKNTGEMTCQVEQISDYAQPEAVCFDKRTNKVVYRGKAFRQSTA